MVSDSIRFRSIWMALIAAKITAYKLLPVDVKHFQRKIKTKEPNISGSEDLENHWSLLYSKLNVLSKVFYEAIMGLISAILFLVSSWDE